MTPLKITAVATRQIEAGEAPTDLLPELKALFPKASPRINRYISLALIGALRCAGRAPTPLPPGSRIALATGMGNVAETQDMVRGILREREPPMPVKFINISGNLAGFQLAASLGLEGSNLIVSRRDFPFEAALELAMADQAGGAGGCALVGGVDECVWPLADHRALLGLPADHPLGEGSNWVCIDEAAARPLARIEWIRHTAAPEELETLLAQIPWQERQVHLATGWGVSPGEHVALAARWQPVQAHPRLGGGHYHQTLSAYAICRFIEEGMGGALLHLNRDAAGRHCALYLTMG